MQNRQMRLTNSSLDNAIERYNENPDNRPWTFIGDLASALGSSDKYKSSQYATFETKNGKVVTIRLSNAFPLSGFVAFGTGNPLLRYGIDTRCQKRLPLVRDAFSEALRAQNRLLGYGRDIRCRKRPPTVRDRICELHPKSWTQDQLL